MRLYASVSKLFASDCQLSAFPWLCFALLPSGLGEDEADEPRDRPAGGGSPEDRGGERGDGEERLRL